MQFTNGAHVYVVNQGEVGRITRVVMNPDTKHVTHVVARRGMIFSEEKVIPIELICDADWEQAILHDEVSDLRDFPSFQETSYLPVTFAEDWGAVPPVATGGWYVNPPMDYPNDDLGVPVHRYVPERRYVESVKQNILDDTIALQEGSRVIGEDMRVVGHVDSIAVDTQTRNVLHFVVVRGRLLKTRRRVPAFWCDIVAEDEVHVSLMPRDLMRYQTTRFLAFDAI